MANGAGHWRTNEKGYSAADMDDLAVWVAAVEPTLPVIKIDKAMRRKLKQDAALVRKRMEQEARRDD